MYLLDTMVVSESFKRQASEQARTWMEQTPPNHLFVSVISFGEIADGIERARSKDEVFAERLDDWAKAMRTEFAERTIPLDLGAAIRWGHLYARLGRRDPDLLIAATALEHDLTVVTRNVRHFQHTCVKLLNPYEA